MLRLYFLAVLIFLAPQFSIASCNCPESNDCAPCKGGIVKLVMRYTGSTTTQVIIKDNKKVYFTGIVTPNQLITINGTKNNGKFETDLLDILVGGILHANIEVSCGQNVFVKSTFGNFVVVSGMSRQGGNLCCASGNNEDTTPPIITNCPNDIEVKINTDICKQAINWSAPIASDGCELKSFINTHAPGAEFPVGITVVTYTATDASDNISTCSFTITVKDGKHPTLKECPADISIEVTEGNEAIADWNIPTATDNCKIPTLKSTYNPGEVFNKGTTSVIYTATDSSGNTTTCKFNITVTVLVPVPLPVPDTSLIVGGFITPDGDGINDEWTIKNIEKYSKNQVKVFDRWGSLLFSTTGYNNNTIAWNGTNTSGAHVPAGTYFYSIELNDESSYTKKGFIELIR